MKVQVVYVFPSLELGNKGSVSKIDICAFEILGTR